MLKINTKLSLLLAVTIFVTSVLSLFPALDVSAASPSWTTLSENTWQLDGSDIVATYSDGTLTITGNGALPDYTIKNMSSRPWHRSIYVRTLKIASTITYIGAYEFANLSYLNNITFGIGTFVADSTSFQGSANYPFFHIVGETPSYVYYGSIAYSSLQSIEAIAYANNKVASFALDSAYLASVFQNSTSPSIENVFDYYSGYNEWEKIGKKDEEGTMVYKLNGGIESDFIDLTDGFNVADIEVSEQKIIPDTNYLSTFANNIGDYTYGFAFTMSVVRLDTYTMTNTFYDYYYTLTLPSELVAAGRTFKLIQISSKGVTILDDLDASDTTVTFATNTPSFTYALVYK